MGADAPRGARRRWVLLAITVAAVLAALTLKASLGDLVPQRGGAELVLRFFARALSPAFRHEGEVPEGTPSLFFSALAAMRRTLVFGVAAMSLALAGGVVLGFLGSSAWWSGARAGGGSAWSRFLYRAIAPSVWGAARVLIVGMRSVHELLWAVLFLAALGLNNVTAVVAIAIPYTGTLAKVFSEMIDEAPRDAAHALRAAGASHVQVFALGLLPRALPDMCAYAFYRFECAIRSSAVLGFFGFPTLGYSISASFENLHFGEVWTYLYALCVLVVGVELWSGALRRRFVA
ncbi:MAG: ABC transporter permease subunit [Planctomycetes bacterium]|nr:ABC transporter permease subunit [Planctomycetota bacterium]